MGRCIIFGPLCSDNIRILQMRGRRLGGVLAHDCLEVLSENSME